MRYNQGIITPPLIQTTTSGTYIFFAIFCAIAYVFTFYCVPETRGLTVEEVDQVFRDSTGAADQDRKRRVLEEVRKSAVDGVAARLMEA